MPSPPNPSLPLILVLSFASCSTGSPQSTPDQTNGGLLPNRGPLGTSAGGGPPSSLKESSNHPQPQKSLKTLPIPPTSEQLTEHLLSLDLGFNVHSDQLLRESIGVRESHASGEDKLTKDFRWVSESSQVLTSAELRNETSLRTSGATITVTMSGVRAVVDIYLDQNQCHRSFRNSNLISS